MKQPPDALLPKLLQRRNYSILSRGALSLAPNDPPSREKLQRLRQGQCAEVHIPVATVFALISGFAAASFKAALRR